MVDNKIVNVNGVGVSSEVPELTPEQKKKLDKLSGGLLPMVQEVQEKPTAIRNGEVVNRFAIGNPDYIKSLPDRIAKTPGKIPTGIPELDYICSGGFSHGLTVLGAQAGTGKTTLLIQSACKIAQQGIVAVYITNDMSSLDLTYKVLSSVSFSILKEDCLTIRRLANKDTYNNSKHINEVYKRTEQSMKYLHIRDLINDKDFDYYCSSQPDLYELDRIERIFEFYCSTYDKVIFFADSLQQIAGYTAGGKEGVDCQLRQFKYLSRKYNVPIVMISTLNRAGYSKLKDLECSDFKESGSIEYDCDTVISMVPKFILEEKTKMTLKEFKESDSRHIVLACKKSRDSAERSVPITLLAPGCTFIPYEGKDTPDSQGNKDTEDTKTPPPESVDWGMVS